MFRSLRLHARTSTAEGTAVVSPLPSSLLVVRPGEWSGRVHRRQNMSTRASVVIMLVGVLCASATRASAQGAGGIAGVVRDSSGAVMPGVTVEASSPALIEKVRSVVSDAEGQYKIIDLRPCTYTVTFTLTGFSTVKREGIEISAGFTATINADLRVGGLEETITVSGQSPVVDTQNVVQQKGITRQM